MSDARVISPEQFKAIDAVFEGTPASFPDVGVRLSTLSTAFRTRVAERLTPALNDLLKEKSFSTPAEYRDAVILVDNLTRDLGLCVSHHGNPAMLADEIAPGSRVRRNFVILVHRGNRVIEKAQTSPGIPTLQLMPVPDGAAVRIDALRDHLIAAAKRGR